MNSSRITREELTRLKNALQGLKGLQFTSLSLPIVALQHIEPSQIGSMVGNLMDALIPHMPDIPQVGLSKHAGIFGDREGYPDYIHTSGFRLELKLLFIDNHALQ